MFKVMISFLITTALPASAYTLCTNSADQRTGIFYLTSGDNCPKYFHPDFAQLGFRRTSRERCIFSSRKLGQNMICRSKLSLKKVEAISKKRRNLRDNAELKERIELWKDVEAALYDPNDINNDDTAVSAPASQDEDCSTDYQTPDSNGLRD